MQPNQVVLWLFPEVDFQEWKEFTGSQLPNYAAYVEALDSVEAYIKKHTDAPIVVRSEPVAWMRERLAASGFKNTTVNRSKVIADLADIGVNRSVLGINIKHAPEIKKTMTGWAMVQGPIEIKSGEHESIDDVFQEMN